MRATAPAHTVMTAGAVAASLMPHRRAKKPTFLELPIGQRFDLAASITKGQPQKFVCMPARVRSDDLSTRLPDLLRGHPGDVVRALTLVKQNRAIRTVQGLLAR